MSNDGMHAISALLIAMLAWFIVGLDARVQKIEKQLTETSEQR